MNDKLTYYIYTLGCKVNRYESEAMSASLSDCDAKFVLINEKTQDKYGSDIFILNSCTVTEESEKKAAKIIRRYRRENPNGILVLCGCIPQAAPDFSQTMKPDIMFGNKNRMQLVALIEQYLQNGRESIYAVSEHKSGDKFEILAPRSYESLTRANLKIEDGCNRFCAYCRIPFARGPVRSMPIDEIKRQAKVLVSEGHREIVVTGINICMYGKDIGSSLRDAVEAIRESGVERIRLGSLEADLISDDFLDYLASLPEFCPQFHISAQSGSDIVLKRMNRRYTSDEYIALADKIYKRFDNPALTTDIIVGFEGETDDEFCDSIKLAERVGFSKIHVFPYSIREGTKAAESKNQISADVKRKRALKLGETGKILAEKFYKMQMEIKHSVLFETYDGVYNYGHTKNFMYVKVPCDKSLENEICDVIIKGYDGEECDGVLAQ